MATDQRLVKTNSAVCALVESELAQLFRDTRQQRPRGTSAPHAGCHTLWVSQGDPDPRYSLANERTFLAWIRTSLGLLVAAAALVAVELPWPADAVRALAVVLAAAAGGSAFASWARWRGVEHAIRTGQAAPPPRAHILLAGSVGLVSVVVIALILM